MQWVDVQSRKDLRERSAPGEPPNALGALSKESKDLLTLWVRKDNLSRRREALLKEGGKENIERTEYLCGWLLQHGWISRRERLQGGRWEWETLIWRDLSTLKGLLGVGSRVDRDERRAYLLAEMAAWVDEQWTEEAEQDAHGFQVSLKRTLNKLVTDRSARLDTLEARIGWIQALSAWVREERLGTRRDFALLAGDHTKAIGANDWRWLDEQFDLERVGVSCFAPTIWLSGDLQLGWGARFWDVGAIQFGAITLEDSMRVESIQRPPVTWWLIENRASFERQALGRDEEVAVFWVPGRPSLAWLRAIEHLVKMAPAPLRVSADADPSGVDIALTVGAVWKSLGQPWAPYRMDAVLLEQTSQIWTLNDYDRALLKKLLDQDDLHPDLRQLCEAMETSGRKAEQESWL